MPLSPSMKVIVLRHDAVFMNAGSYVTRPKSSGAVLICLRSMARIAPSLIGSSYCFPVRLSTTVRVSPVAFDVVDEAAAFRSVVTLFAMLLVLILVVGRGYRFAWHLIAAVRPSRQVLVAASLAAERTPPLVHRTRAAEHAERRVAHPVNDSAGFRLRATGSGRLQTS